MRRAKQKSQIPLRVQFRHMPTSDAMKQLIQLKIEPLQKFSTAGSHCEVVVDELERQLKKQRKRKLRYRLDEQESRYAA